MEEHPDTGAAVEYEGVPSIIDNTGVIRKLGAIPPKTLAHSFLTFPESGIKAMSDDEIKLYLSTSAPRTGRDAFGSDWILDQKSHGSCAGFATAGACNRAFYMDGQGRLTFNGAWCYSLGNRNSDNGSIPEEVIAAVQKNGLMPVHSSADWDKIYQSQYTASDRAEAAKYRLGPDNVLVTNDRQEFLTGIALGWKGVIAVHVGNNFMRLDSRGVSGFDSGPGNHAVCIDGLKLLGSTIGMDLPNSWNTTFGQDGRTYVIFEEHCRQTAQNFNFFLVRGALDIVGGDKPPAIA